MVFPFCIPLPPFVTYLSSLMGNPERRRRTKKHQKKNNTHTTQETIPPAPSLFTPVRSAWEVGRYPHVAACLVTRTEAQTSFSRHTAQTVQTHSDKSNADHRNVGPRGGGCGGGRRVPPSRHCCRMRCRRWMLRRCFGGRRARADSGRCPLEAGSVVELTATVAALAAAALRRAGCRSTWRGFCVHQPTATRVGTGCTLMQM